MKKQEFNVKIYQFFIYLILICLIAYWILFLIKKTTNDILKNNWIEKQWKNIETVINNLTTDNKENTNTSTEKKNTFIADDWTEVEMKDNRVDSVDELDFSYEASEKTWLWIIATDDDWYFVTNYNDFDFDEEWNLPSIADKLIKWPERNDWFEVYELDLSKKLDKRLYEATQWFNESALKRTWVDSKLIDKFRYAVYKKWNFYKITVEWISDEEKEEIFYLWKIELNYLSFWNYFWWVIDNEEILDRWYNNVYTLWEENITIENINYTDDDETKLDKFYNFIYSLIYNSWDLQKWNEIKLNIHKVNTINWENWIELECYTWEMEDYYYWYKLELWNLCTIFQDKQFKWYTNEMSF